MQDVISVNQKNMNCEVIRTWKRWVMLCVLQGGCVQKVLGIRTLP